MRYLTVNEAAAALNLSAPTVKRYLYEGKLRSAKLPGGQHRIPESEIERLLAPGAHDEGGLPEAAEGLDMGERLAVLERWVTEIQADLERLEATIEVVSRFCAQTQPSGSEPRVPGDDAFAHRVLVLGPGCRRCDALYELTSRILQALGRTDVSLSRVTSLDDLAAFGPILTPSLVVDDEILISGRVPSEDALRKALERKLG